MTQAVKNLPVRQETQGRSLGGKIPRRRAWRPTAVFLPGEFHAQRIMEGYRPQDHKASDMTEVT